MARSNLTEEQREQRRGEPRPKGAYELLEDAYKEAELNARLGKATPLERRLYEEYGLEPGLDRATFFPYAGRRDEGNLEFATPAFLYDLIKAGSAPGAVAEGVEVSPEEIVEAGMNMTTGGLGVSHVAGPTVTGPMFGMAVKPKGGVFFPKGTPSGLDKYLKDISTRLPDISPVSNTIISDKARKYFTTTFGTANDPLRTAMLEGRLTAPSNRGIAGFKDYLMEAATRDYRRRRELADPNTDARIDFERAYDEKTGLEPYLFTNSPEGFMAGDRRPMSPREDLEKRNYELRDEKISTPMISSGVHPDLVNPRPISIEDVGERLKEVNREIADTKLALREKGYSEDRIENDFVIQRMQEQKSKLQQLSGKTDDRLLPTAVERGDIVYDVKPWGPSLPFLVDSRVRRSLSTLTNEQIENMSFPEMIIAGEKNLARYGDLDAAVARVESGKAVPKSFWLKEGVEPALDLGSSKWMRITDPEYTRLESAHMGHSVRGYAEKGSYNAGGRDAIIDGSARIYSLRDSETGLPRVTLEVNFNESGNPIVKQIKGKQNAAPRDEAFEVMELLDELKVDPDNIYENNHIWGRLYDEYREIKYGKDASTSDDFNRGGRVNTPINTPTNYSKGRWRLI